MSYKLKTTFIEWKTKQPGTPLPFVEHDLEASDVMSLALTVIAMCRLREDLILNDLRTCEDAQKRAWEELRQLYSTSLVVLL